MAVIGLELFPECFEVLLPKILISVINKFKPLSGLDESGLVVLEKSKLIPPT